MLRSGNIFSLRTCQKTYDGKMRRYGYTEMHTMSPWIGETKTYFLNNASNQAKLNWLISLTRALSDKIWSISLDMTTANFFTIYSYSFDLRIKFKIRRYRVSRGDYPLEYFRDCFDLHLQNSVSGLKWNEIMAFMKGFWLYHHLVSTKATRLSFISFNFFLYDDNEWNNLRVVTQKC